MSIRTYGFCPKCKNEVFNCHPNYLINIKQIKCGKCNTFSYTHQLIIENKETSEFDVFLSPYEALSELQKGTNLGYLNEDLWFTLFKDSPIRLLWEYKIRVK